MEESATHESGTELSVDDTASLLEARMDDDTVIESSIENPETEEVEEEVVEPEAELSTEEGEVEEEVVEEKEEKENAEEEEAEQEAEPEEIELDSLTDLAEHFEIDPDSLEGLKVKIKVNGEETEVPLAELRNGYQREADYSRKTQEVAEQRKAVESEFVALQAERAQHIQAIDQLGWVLRQSIEGADFEELRESDPAEYAARMEDRRQKIEHFQRMGQQREALAAQEQALQQEQLQERLNVEDKLLLDALPEWKDESKRREGSQRVSSYLADLGFAAEEINNVVDHRLITLAEKARQFDELKKQAPVVKKKVIKTPKLQKPTAPSKADSKTTAAVKRVKQTGKVDDVAQALLSRWN